MRNFCRILFVLLLLARVDFGFANVPSQQFSESSYSVSSNVSSLTQSSSTSFPSHGYALLILRFNETAKERYVCSYHETQTNAIWVNYNSVINHWGYNWHSFSFSPNPFKYEAFLYSLPLRSPPLC
jgi:hypothetical protein